MKVRVWVMTLLVAGVFCVDARAGNPPAKSADARNVSGLETGDAGQTIKPSPANADGAAAAAFQRNNGASVGWSGFAVAGALVSLGLFLLFVVRAQAPLFTERDDRRREPVERARDR